MVPAKHQLQKIGVKLFQRGLNNSHSGNISYREKDLIYISKTGGMCDDLGENDIVAVGLVEDFEQDRVASMELKVHRAIYQVDDKIRAVVHAHAPYAIVEAEGQSNIVPYDEEGQYFLKAIPVMNVGQSIASDEVAAKIPDYVQASPAVVVARHGVFAWGASLEDAYHYITVVESACKINYLRSLKHVT